MKDSFFIRGKTLFYSISALFSLCIYFASPQTYSWGYCMFCGGVYLVSVYLYLTCQKKDNYFDFETIFLISYFFCFFAYPIFIYKIDPEYFFIFSYNFDHDKISQGTSLALLGSQFFLLGCQLEASYNKFHLKHLYIYPVRTIHILTVLLFLGFIAFGGYRYFKDLYSGGGQGGVFAYFIILYIAFYILSIAFEFNNMLCSHQKTIRYFNKLFLFFTIISVVVLLTTGTRTLVLQMLLPFIGLYSMFISPIGLRKFLLLSICGALLLSIISFVRVGQDIALDSIWDIFMDLIINNRSTYFALSYVDDYGISWGGSMLGYLLKPFPFSQGVVCNFFDLNPLETTSAMLITVETLGENPSFGLGTNIIADLYLGFGLPGVVFFMFFLGKISKKLYFLAKKGVIYGILFYAILLSLSIYMVRSEYFYGLNLFLWTFLITNFIIGLIKRKLIFIKQI